MPHDDRNGFKSRQTNDVIPIHHEPTGGWHVTFVAATDHHRAVHVGHQVQLLRRAIESGATTGFGIDDIIAACVGIDVSAFHALTPTTSPRHKPRLVIQGMALHTTSASTSTSRSPT